MSFGIWDLEIGIWELANFTLERKVPPYQSGFQRLNVVPIKVTMAIILQDTPNLARGLLPGGARG